MAATKFYMGSWIPVEERLPEDEKDVLITVVDHNCDDDVFVEFGYFDFDYNEWYCYSCDEEDMDVIAWMEHPDPYRKEQTNERT